jgi:DnaJ-class molecular chaperone
VSADTDYYSVLGVLPDAEHVVIVAAYRALASLYHPDRWKGDVAAATNRMAEINVAYGVLSDAEKRKAFDSSRSSSRSSFGDNDEENDFAFDEALTELEERWQVAVEIFPDLVDIRTRLSKTAHRLAFAFVTVLLETKRFSERREISEALENSFLERYFGTDPAIIVFVQELISAGQREAVKAVSRYVDVLGSDIPASTIRKKLKANSPLNPPHFLSAKSFIPPSLLAITTERQTLGSNY